MKIAIKGTNISLTESITSYVNNKLSSFEKFSDSPDSIMRVEVGKTTMHHQSGNFFRAEVNVILKGKEYYAVAEKDDLYAAIDRVSDELFTKVTSYKEKRITFVRRSGAKIKNLIKGIFTRKSKS